MQSFETALSFSSASSSNTMVKGGGKREERGKWTEETKYVKAAREKVEARVDFLEGRIVPKCYVWVIFSFLYLIF